MENILRRINLQSSEINPTTLRFLILLITLILFVLGAGAPTEGGGWGG